MKLIVALIAFALLVPAVADASGVLTFRQARKAVRAYQQREKAQYPDFTYENQGCKRVRARRIDCTYDGRNAGSAKCHYRAIVRKSRATGRISVVKREAFDSTPWCRY